MRYAKLVGNRLRFSPNPILFGELRIGNPPEELYLSEGYKPVHFTELPEAQGFGWYEVVWSETENAIIQSWQWHESEDTDELSDSEAMQLLLGGEVS